MCVHFILLGVLCWLTSFKVYCILCLASFWTGIYLLLLGRDKRSVFLSSHADSSFDFPQHGFITSFWIWLLWIGKYTGKTLEETAALFDGKEVVQNIENVGNEAAHQTRNRRRLLKKNSRSSEPAYDMLELTLTRKETEGSMADSGSGDVGGGQAEALRTQSNASSYGSERRLKIWCGEWVKVHGLSIYRRLVLHHIMVPRSPFTFHQPIICPDFFLALVLEQTRIILEILVYL